MFTPLTKIVNSAIKSSASNIYTTSEKQINAFYNSYQYHFAIDSTRKKKKACDKCWDMILGEWNYPSHTNLKPGIHQISAPTAFLFS